MRISWRASSLATTASLLLAASFPPTTLAMDCNVKFDSNKWNLQPLGGVHEFQTQQDKGYVNLTTTWVMNICNILHHAATRGSLYCGTSKNICAFQNAVYNETGSHREDPYPIVGYEPLGGGKKDIELSRLKKGDDGGREGLSVKMSGGGYYIPPNETKKKNTAAVINFYCDPDRTGLEGLENIQDPSTPEEDPSPPEDEEQVKKVLLARDDDDSAPGPNSLLFKSFEPEDDVYVLRLNWYTRYGCDDYVKDHPNGDELTNTGSHWGFFTWLIIIFFLGTAAYLIFGSWLNYNRYGARGWDLLPHGDTIRDIPYIFQDWLRRVINTLQGPGSRGGYSAV